VSDSARRVGRTDLARPRRVVLPTPARFVQPSSSAPFIAFAMIFTAFLESISFRLRRCRRIGGVALPDTGLGQFLNVDGAVAGVRNALTALCPRGDCGAIKALRANASVECCHLST